MELYKEDLEIAYKLFIELAELSSYPDITEIEIRFRVNDSDSWITIGYGETGYPCILIK